MHRQLSRQPIKVLPARISGGGPPGILADIRGADLVADWQQRAADLMAAR